MISRKLKRRRGLTLLEIVVVLVIIGVLVALVAPRVETYIRDAKITAAKAEVRTIVTSLNSYYNTQGQYPSDLYVIGKDYLDKAKINDNKQLLDPWGVPYNYKSDSAGGVKSQRFVLSSAGPDNLHGNRDDISEAGGSKVSRESSGDEFDENLESELVEEKFD